MNKLKYLYTSSFVFWVATNLISPFIGIFTIDQIKGGGISEYGISSLIFFLAFGLSVGLIGRYVDKMPGLKDDFYASLFGFLFRGVLFITLAFITDIFQLYLIQLALGISRGFSDSVKEKIQIELTAKKLISTSFSLNTGIVNIAAAIGAGIGGYAAEMVGFRILFIIVGILTIFSGLIFSFSIKYLKPKF